MRPHIRLALPNVSANAASVGDYINQNYLHTYNSVTFDVVAENKDFFSGTLSTDSLANVTGRTVWGIIQQRSGSANNSTAYKYFASGIGGAGSVSPFSSEPTLIGTFGGNVNTDHNLATFSLTSYKNYKNITLADMLIVIQKYGHSSNGASNESFSWTYNQSTGALSVSHSAMYNITIDVYVK